MAGIEKVPAPRAGAHTVIGSSIVIDGEISGDEDLVIQGTVKGRISLPRPSISQVFILRPGTASPGALSWLGTTK